MITNLVVSIVTSLVTNTTEIMPQVSVPQASPSIGMNTLAVLITKPEPQPDPKEKWIKSTISEITTYSFIHNGQPVKQSETRELTNWTTYFVLAPPPPPIWLESTNNKPVPMTWPIGYPGLK